MFKSRFEKVQKQYEKGYRKNYRKKASAVAKKRYYERADTAVCHILSILGYSSIDNIHRNQAMFDDVMDFVCTIKARVISRTQLMKDPVDRVETMTNEEINVSENDKKRLKCIESTLLQRLPRDDYNSLVKKINVDMIDGNKFDSYHILAKDLPSLSPLQTTYEHRVKVVQADNQPTTRVDTVTAKGATASVEDALRLFLRRTEKMVQQVDGLTMEKSTRKVLYYLLF